MIIENQISSTVGLSILGTYGIGMIILSLIISKNREQNRSEFLLANRDVGVGAGAMCIAASWIWAPALFVSSQKSFENGLAGLFWFLVPNVITLMVFALFASRLRELLPNGYTLPQYIRLRHGKGAHALYLLQFLLLQAGALTIQAVAASQLLKTVCGVPSFLGGSLVIGFALVYAIIGGLRTSVVSDYIQMAVVLVICGVMVPTLMTSAGGIETVMSGLGGINHISNNPFNFDVFISFGLPITISLLAAPLGDQMQWQRAYALKKGRIIVPAFVLGALIYSCVPIALSIFGFIAASPHVAGNISISNPQMVGPAIAGAFLPPTVLYGYLFVFLAGLCSTADSSLCAVASLCATDCLPKNATSLKILRCIGIRMDQTKEVEKEYIKFSRFCMFGLAILAFCIAQIPGVQLLHIMLAYGAVRAATMIPTMVTLFRKNVSIPHLATILACAMGVGLILRIIGDSTHNAWLSTTGTTAAVIISSLVMFDLKVNK